MRGCGSVVGGVGGVGLGVQWVGCEGMGVRVPWVGGVGVCWVGSGSVVGGSGSIFVR